MVFNIKRHIYRNIYIIILLLIIVNGQAQDSPGFLPQLTVIDRIDTLLIMSDLCSYDYPDSSINMVQHVLSLIDDSISEEAAKAQKIMADARYYKNDFVAAITSYSEAANIESILNGTLSEGYALRINDVGYCYYVMGIYDLALENYQKALSIFDAMEIEDERINTVSNIGTVYFNMGAYEKAITCFEETLAFDLAIGHDYEVSVTNNNIGKVYQAWGKYTQALDYFNRSLSYAIQNDRLDLQSVRISNLGMVYLEMGDTETALEMLNSALHIDSLQNNAFKVAIRKSELSRIYAGLGNHQKAINLSKEALLFFEDRGINESRAIVLNDLGRYYLYEKDYNESQLHFEKGARSAQSIRSDKMLLSSWIGLSDLFEAKGDFQKALFYNQKADSLDKVIFNEVSHRQLANYEIKYRTKEAEVENELLRNEVNRRKTRIILLLFGLAGLLIIMVLLLRVNALNRKSLKQQKLVAAFEKAEKERERVHYEDKVFAEKQINRLQREKYDTEIAHKNQLLVNSTLGLVQKNEVLLQLKDKVKSLPSDDYIKEIFELIRDNIDQDQNWKKFRVEFTSIHPRFFDNLTAKFPDLSDNNIQLCAYLRINLSSKEIANLMSISVSSVNKSRQRLRKKLQLEPETDLTGYLSAFD